MKAAHALVAIVRKSVKGAHIKVASEGGLASDVVEWIPSGFSGLDHILGGGWAVGRASEVAGPEGAGKSALAQMAVRECQRLGGLVVYLDFEHALDPKKVARLGIDPESLIYIAPDYIEQGWNVIWATMDGLEKNPPAHPTLLVWDSVGGSLTKAMLEGNAEDSFVGAVSRVMTPNCAKMFGAISRVRAHMMFINQERDAFGKFVRFGPPPKQTPGGAGLKYAASLRVRCSRVMTLKNASNVASGYLIKTVTDKNRIVPPHRKVTWVLDFDVGPSESLTLFEVLKDAGKIVAVVGKPGLYTIRGLKTAPFNRSGWSERLGADVALENHARALYVAVVKEGGPKVGAAASSED